MVKYFVRFFVLSVTFDIRCLVNSFFQDLPMITEMLDAVDQKENGKEEV